MFKVLLQYLIPWCILSAILLNLRSLLGEVSEKQGMTSTGLHMEYLKPGSSEKYRMCEGDPALKEKVKDDQRTARSRRNIDTGTNLSEHKLKLKGIKLRTTIDQDEQCCVSTKRTLTEITVHSSQQHIAVDLCLIFAYHIASKETFTTFFATMALLFWKVSALPLNQPGSKEQQKIERRTMVDSNHERKVRNAPDTQSIGNCQSEWFQNEDSCYRVFPGKMNYDSAAEHCSSVQAKLVTLETLKENTFVDQLHPDGYLWTGVQKLCKNCSHIGKYANWCPGQPDRKSNCVVMVDYGQWKNFDCNYMFAYVCEKEAYKPLYYSRQQLLLALLIPIFSCLTLAVTFTTFLLVSSVRRGNQPFKIASRYARTKGKRKIATWEMIETIRRASLQRASLRRKHLRQRTSVPNIEVTSPDGGDGAKPPNGREKKSKRANGKTNSRAMLWWRKGKAPKPKPFLEMPMDRRRSSGTGSSSSLYELLVLLNRMEFDPEKENQRIDVVGDQRDVERGGEMSAGDDGEVSGEDREELVVESRPTDDESCDRKQSFENMAFRDSAASVETSAGGGGITRTSLDPGKDTPGHKHPGENSSPEKAAEIELKGNDTRRKDTHGKDTPGKDSGVISRNTESNSVKINSHSLNKMDYSMVINEDDLEMSENTKVVKVDVHRTSKSEDPPTRSDRVAIITALDPDNDTPEKTSRVINGDELEMGENRKVVKVDVHRTSKSEDPPTTRVAMITALDPENDTPEKNSGEVSRDGESNCVELQSRAPDRVCKSDELKPSDELEPSKNTQTVKVDVERTSNGEDNSASVKSTEANNNDKTSSKGNVLWIYSV